MIVWVVFGLVVLLSADAGAQRAHEHGVATLNVALDGHELVVQLESPLDNLVGFEHAPRTDRQRAVPNLKRLRAQRPLPAVRAAAPSPAASARSRSERWMRTP